MKNTTDHTVSSAHSTSALTHRGTRQEVSTETVAELRSSQVIFPTWMEEACAGLGDDDLVVVVREHAGFMGTFVRQIFPGAKS